LSNERTGVTLKIILNIKVEASPGKTHNINNKSGASEGAAGKVKESIWSPESNGKLIARVTPASL